VSVYAASLTIKTVRFHHTVYLYSAPKHGKFHGKSQRMSGWRKTKGSSFVLRMILTVNGYYFRPLRSPTGLSIGRSLFCLWGMNWTLYIV